MLNSSITDLVKNGNAVNDNNMPSWVCVCAGCAGTNAPQGNILPQGSGGSPLTNSPDRVATAPMSGASSDASTLMAGSRWSNAGPANSKTVITFSFADAASVYDPGVSAFSASKSGFSEGDKAATREILASIEAVANVQFIEVADNAGVAGVLRYAYSQGPNDMGFAGYAFYPSASAIGGSIWIGKAQAGVEWDHYRPGLILHETLHALGLKHPFEGGATLSVQDNIIPNTVMSYSPVAGSNSGAMSRYPSEPMPLDIKALQALYGSSDTRSGDTTYNLADASFQTNFRAIWDSAGNDTLDAGQVAGSVFLDLNAGMRSDIGFSVSAFTYSGSGGGRTFTQTNYNATLSIAEGTLIENAIGSAFDDVLKGNSANNRLEGGKGNDRLIGGSGNDILIGGEGTDTAVYYGNRAGFTVKKTGSSYVVSDKSGAEGTDTLTSMERLEFADRGVALDMDGNGGLAAMLLGAIVGKSAVLNAGQVGRVLSMLESGMGENSVADSVIDLALGVPHTHKSFVNVMYTNVTGRAPTADVLNYYSGLLDSNMASQSSLALMAARSDENKMQINLVGLANSGLDYVLPA